MEQKNLAPKIKALAVLFKSKMGNSKNWQITLKEILETTRFDMNRYTQNLYAFDHSDFVSHLEKINANNLGHFLHFLNQHYFKESLKIFSNQGIFLNFNQRIELSDYFYHLLIELSAAHNIDFDNFKAMFTHYKSFDRAWECYESQYFDQEKTRFYLLAKYRQDHPQSPILDLCLENYLEQLFQRKIIIVRLFLEKIIEKLHNYIFPEKTGENFRQKIPASIKREQKNRALTTLGFYKLPDLASLKKRYKQLMKQYHPDINQEGLEQSKSINIAYQQILIIIEKGASTHE
ncbi:MAG: J domain-containing protein [Spirochaetales bacterium]|nr:J domain-containing protein [Spirochaetales bacterium]